MAKWWFVEHGINGDEYICTHRITAEHVEQIADDAVLADGVEIVFHKRIDRIQSQPMTIDGAEPKANPALVVADFIRHNSAREIDDAAVKAAAEMCEEVVEDGAVITAKLLYEVLRKHIDPTTGGELFTFTSRGDFTEMIVDGYLDLEKLAAEINRKLENTD